MLDQALTELFDQQASEEPPPVRASIAIAVRSGRRTARRRRVIAVGTPLLAAVAVLAIALTSALSVPAPTRPVQHGKPAHSLPLAPREFNPLVPYVSYGWLPQHARVTAVATGRRVVLLFAVGPQQENWQVSVFARGDCALRNTRFTCRDLTSLQYAIATRKAPSIDGFRAYWDFPSVLIFQYAGGGWATLELPGHNHQADGAGRAMAVHIAQTLRFGARTASVRFPAQVTRMPPGWAIRQVMLSYSRQRPLAWSYEIAPRARLAAPWFDSNNIPDVVIGPASQNPLGCNNPPGQFQQTMLAGHQVTIQQLPAGREPAQQSVCAASADGLAVLIVISGNHPPISASRLFTRMRLLGPDPADWTTKPIG